MPHGFAPQFYPPGFSCVVRNATRASSNNSDALLSMLVRNLTKYGSFLSANKSFG